MNTPPKIDLLANLNKLKPEVHDEVPPGYTLLIDECGHYGYKIPNKDHVICADTDCGESHYSRQDAIDMAWRMYHYIKNRPENRTWKVVS